MKFFKIRPAARHILTIGKELIHDPFAAIIELVKNSYDADSEDVIVDFSNSVNKSLLITVTDHGIGMSEEDIVTKWLVPSTNNKILQRYTKNGRIVQGRKGIGRYAASILGQKITLKSSKGDGIVTSLTMNWMDFEAREYLDQIDVALDTIKTKCNSGTSIVIECENKDKEFWNRQNIDKLVFELRKLISPVRFGYSDDNFSIKLKINAIYDDLISELDIKPFPLMDFYDYRISGSVKDDGNGMFKYESNKADKYFAEDLKITNQPTGCGNVSIDIRAYDRDGKSLDVLIKRGLKDETGRYLNKIETRRLLDNVNGIGVYRNGFRIRPLGDADFDWLKLNERRVLNPSMRLGSNQVIGCVNIDVEEKSGLEEKSARDGLKENEAFASLKKLTQEIIAKLEEKRFVERRNLNYNDIHYDVDDSIQRVYFDDKVNKLVVKELENNGVKQSVVENIINMFEEDKKRKRKDITKLQKTISLYQGQATVGKIIDVVLHEGRRPLNFFKNQSKNLKFYVSEFIARGNKEDRDEVVNIANGFDNNAKYFVGLFDRLDPLATKKNEDKKDYSLVTILRESLEMMDEKLKSSKVVVNVTCPNDLKIFCWKRDLYAIFVNLLDNSIFWINNKNKGERKIDIVATKIGNSLNISYQDTGSGIDKSLLESGVIFEPQFSTKPNGMGLGLSIAGEAAIRNGLNLQAIVCETGAKFILTSI